MRPAVRVVGLGARCEVDTGPDEPPWRAHFSVQEFADLSDGRRVRAGGKRGFGSQLNMTGRDHHSSIWETFTLESLESGVRTVLLPDADDGEDDVWRERSRQIAQLTEIDVSITELKALPYTLEFGQDILDRLQRIRPRD